MDVVGALLLLGAERERERECTLLAVVYFCLHTSFLNERRLDLIWMELQVQAGLLSSISI